MGTIPSWNDVYRMPSAPPEKQQEPPPVPAPMAENKGKDARQVIQARIASLSDSQRWAEEKYEQAQSPDDWDALLRYKSACKERQKFLQEILDELNTTEEV